MKIKMNNSVGPQVRSAKPKTPKLLPILGGVSLVGGLQAATQFFAYTFQYHASLGANLGHVYAPWSILNWSAKWYSQYPDEIMRAGSIGMVTATVGLLGVALATLWERLAFTGLLNLSTDYRTTALFWEMHVGGAALDGFLALTVPFALREVLVSP